MKHDEKACYYLSKKSELWYSSGNIKTGRILNYRCTSSNLNAQAITKQNSMHSNCIAILIKNTQYILTAILQWSRNHPEHSQSNTLKIEELVRRIFLMTWNIVVTLYSKVPLVNILKIWITMDNTCITVFIQLLMLVNEKYSRSLLVHSAFTCYQAQLVI